MLLRDFAVPPGKVHAERSKDVDAGEDVGGGVCLIEGDDPSGKHIFLGIHRGPHGLSVGEQGADQQAQGHPRKEKDAEPVIVLAVCEKEIRDGARHVHEPQEIRDNKIFVKRDPVVEGGVDHMVMAGDGLLQTDEPWQIDKAIA